VNIDEAADICAHLSMARQSLKVSSPNTDALAARIGEVEGTLNPGDSRYVGDAGAALQKLNGISLELGNLFQVQPSVVSGVQTMPGRPMPTLLAGVIDALAQLGKAALLLGRHVN
jgi:5-enolpyruvylshikimate-3-phosphate synthase